MSSEQTLGKKEVAYISRLAAIAVAPQEVDAVAAKLSNILELFAQLEAVDVTGVEPLAHPLEQTQRLRLDEVTEQNLAAKYQKLAPAVEGGLYLVPQVIE